MDWGLKLSRIIFRTFGKQKGFWRSKKAGKEDETLNIQIYTRRTLNKIITASIPQARANSVTKATLPFPPKQATNSVFDYPSFLWICYWFVTIVNK